jgi:hypothetical protein
MTAERPRAWAVSCARRSGADRIRGVVCCVRGATQRSAVILATSGSKTGSSKGKAARRWASVAAWLIRVTRVVNLPRFPPSPEMGLILELDTDHTET